MTQDFEERLKKVEESLEQLNLRNQKVELEKAWETSAARKISIVIITYLLMSLIFYTIGVGDYFTNALIPTVGYFLSTQSLPLIKKIWLKKGSS